MSRVDCNNCAALFKSVGTLADGIAALQRDNAALREALEVMIDHAGERYPHFENPRGQRDIAQARAALRQADQGEK